MKIKQSNILEPMFPQHLSCYELSWEPKSLVSLLEHIDIGLVKTEKKQRSNILPNIRLQENIYPVYPKDLGKVKKEQL